MSDQHSLTPVLSHYTPPTTPLSHRELSKDLDPIKQLKETLRYVLQILEENDKNDQQALKLYQTLQPRYEWLKEHHTLELTSLHSTELKHDVKQKAQQLPIQENAKCDTLLSALQAFVKANLLPHSNGLSHLHSLIYSVEIAVSQVFPANQILQNDLLSPQAQTNGEIAYEKVLEPNRLIPARNKNQVLLLLLPEFIIKHANYCWQDQIRAAYQLTKEKKTLNNIVLKGPQDFEDDLELLQEGSTPTTKHSKLFFENLVFYYEMIWRGATQTLIKAWQSTFEEQKISNPQLKAWMLLICEYSILARQKLCAIDPESLDGQGLFEKIKAHSSTASYLGVAPNINDDQLKEKIENALINLSSYTVYQRIQDENRCIEDVLKVSKKDRIQLKPTRTLEIDKAAHIDHLISKAEYDAFIQSDQLSNTIDFKMILKHLGIDAETLWSQLKKKGTTRDFLEYFLDDNILKMLSNNLKAYHFEYLLYTPGVLGPFVESLNSIRSNRSVHSSLDRFITDYNASEDNEPIYLSKFKKELGFLERDSVRFKKNLNSNAMAQEVLYKSCPSLFIALENYADFPKLLRGISKDENRKLLKQLTQRYCINAENTLILRAIRDSKLAIDIALGIDQTNVDALQEYHDQLFSVLTSGYVLDKEEKEHCEHYVYDNLREIFKKISPEEGFVTQLENELKKLDNSILIGLVQLHRLSLDEVWGFNSTLKTRFQKVDRQFNALHSKTIEWINQKGSKGLPSIIAKVARLTETRNRLDELKKGNLQEKEQYDLEKETFFDELIASIEHAMVSLNGEFDQSIHNIPTKIIPFPELLTMEQSDRERLREDCEKAKQDFVDYVEETKNDVNLLSRIQTLEELLQSLDATKDPREIYPDAMHIIRHASSKVMIQCHKDYEVLSIGQIAKLTDPAIALLEKRYSTLKLSSDLNQSEYITCLKAAFKLYISSSDKVTETQMSKILGFYFELCRCIKNSLIIAIMESTKMSLEVFIDAFIQYRNNQKPPSQWLSELKVKYKTINQRIAQDASYHTFFAECFSKDKASQSFSLENFLKRCDTYLENAKSPLADYFIEKDLTLTLIFPSKRSEHDDFYQAKAYFIKLATQQIQNEVLLFDCEDLSSQISFNDDQHKTNFHQASELFEQLLQHLSTTSASLSQVVEAIQTASIKLEDPNVLSLCQKGLSPLIAICLSPVAVTCLHQLTFEVFNANTSLAMMQQDFEKAIQLIEEKTKAIQPLINEQSIISHLLKRRSDRVKEIIENPVAIDLVMISHAFDTANENRQMRSWWTECNDANLRKYEAIKYESSSEMLYDCFDRSKLPLNQLKNFLQEIIRLSQSEKSIERINKLIDCKIPVYYLLSITREDINNLTKQRRQLQKERLATSSIKRTLLEEIRQLQNLQAEWREVHAEHRPFNKQATAEELAHGSLGNPAASQSIPHQAGLFTKKQESHRNERDTSPRDATHRRRSKRQKPLDDTTKQPYSPPPERKSWFRQWRNR